MNNLVSKISQNLIPSSKIPEVLTLSEIEERDGKSVEKSIYFSLFVGDIKCIYEPDFNSKINGKYTRYTLRWSSNNR